MAGRAGLAPGPGSTGPAARVDEARQGRCEAWGVSAGLAEEAGRRGRPGGGKEKRAGRGLRRWEERAGRGDAGRVGRAEDGCRPAPARASGPPLRVRRETGASQHRSHPRPLSRVTPLRTAT